MIELEQEPGSSLRAEVVQVGQRCANAQYRLVRVVAALDTSEEWALDGAITCAHWVADALDVEVCTAREWLRIGHALEALPLTDAAFATGRLSYSKIRTLTRVATPDTETELCELAERVPAGRLACEIARWRSERESPEETEARQKQQTSLTTRIDVDGMGVIRMRLPPADFGTVLAMVETRVRNRRPHASADAWPPFARQRAEALMELLIEGGGQLVTELVLHVRGDGCTLDDGTPIPDTVVERIAPNAFLRALIHDAERRPINASGRQRHPTARQKRVVKERDGVCVDCGSPFLLEYDHEPPYEESHRTLTSEIEGRCAICHHLKHRQRPTG
jgi:5-methylcytosine-specific restriction endonuclease McrA